MPWADLLLVIALGSFAAYGAYRGLIRQVVAVLGLVLSLVIATWLYLPLASLLQATWRIPLPSEPVAFALLVVVVWATVDLAGVLVGARARDAQHAWLDVLGGMLFGLLTGTLLLATLIVGLDLLGMAAGQQLAASLIGGWLLVRAQGIIALLWGG
jgi:uncharacterized membrane protein required for colicin V production